MNSEKRKTTSTARAFKLETVSFSDSFGSCLPPFLKTSQYNGTATEATRKIL